MTYAVHEFGKRVCGFRSISRRAFVSAFLALCFSSPVHSADVTPHVESLGIPFAERYPSGEAVYARNVWDLQAFRGRLYVGGGNSDNKGPAPNAGPVPILAWDPGTNRFVCEGEVDDEEISRFQVISGTLYIPGADPRESWKRGNLYRREPDGQWLKLRTIPRAIHAYALTTYQGRLYVGLKATDTVPWYADFKGYGAAVAMSEDRGDTWEFLPLGGFAVFEFLQVAGHLYAMDLTLGPGLEKWISKQDREDYYAPAYALDPSQERFVRRPDLDAARLFPKTPKASERACGIHRSASLGDSAIYVGASGNGPFGLYRADSFHQGDVRTARIPLPEAHIPRDLLVRGETVFVLLQGPKEAAGVKIRIQASRDLEKWVDLLEFTAPTFARSFEILEGDIYLGLGYAVNGHSEWKPEEVHPETGRLLRVKGVHVPELRAVMGPPDRSVGLLDGGER